MICGIDEAGRGCLAGPVTAAAVVLAADFPARLLNDSKKTAPGKRATLAGLIQEKAIEFALGWAWPKEIDALNIHRATLLAMQRAYYNLKKPVNIIYVDGLHAPPLPGYCRAIVKGDSSIPSIQAASIIAKTSRDALMLSYQKKDSRYSFAQHKGYPTRQHVKEINKHGRSGVHRLSFRVPGNYQ